MKPFVNSSDFFAMRAMNSPCGIDFSRFSTRLRNEV